MTVAVDTNILLDILSRGADDRLSSLEKLRTALRDGEVIVGEVVFAELAPAFADHVDARSFLDETGISYRPSSEGALHHAGMRFRAYLRRRMSKCPICGTGVDVACSSCGTAVTGRQHLVADFMIGAHALVHAGRLLTRDRGYYAMHFPELTLI